MKPADGSACPARWAHFNARDSSMYQNLEWVLSQPGAPRKVILWTATAHAVRTMDGVVTDTDTSCKVPLGHHVHQRF